MTTRKGALAVAAACVLGGAAFDAGAAVPGLYGCGAGATTTCATPVFELTARGGHITLGDGNSLYAWGFSPRATVAPDDPATMQYPGPTLIVQQGATVTVTLKSDLPLPVSIVFPGQSGVQATGGAPGILTNEASGADTVTYTFVAGQPGTYLYQSGTRPELEIEMGLVGALVVRPAGFDTAAPRAYGSAGTAYDREYLFVLTEMDRTAHERAENIVKGLAPGADAGAALEALEPAKFASTLWFINGRNGPDTLLDADVQWLPTQPYNARARMHPADRVLMRLVGAGRDLHPFHHHGNNAWMIARDGRVLASSSAATAPYPDFDGVPGLASAYSLPNQSVSNYTIQVVPGSTYDALFTWTGKGLGWDVYGHKPSNGACPPAEEHEDPASHCKVFAATNDTLPVVLPEQQALTFGGYWSGDPYLGTLEPLPPLQGGLNPNGGYTFMWHSHTERELTNDDIFPGGMMTLMVIEAPNVEIAE